MPIQPDKSFSDDEVARILKKIAYHQTFFDKVVAHQPLSKATPQLLLNPTKPSSCGIGRLTCLPPELISNVCLLLDLLSIFRFSKVNRRARSIIAIIPQVRRLADHAANCLWLMLNSGLAKHVTAVSLYAALTTKACTFYEDFGGFVILPTAQRCCFLCMKNRAELQPVYLKTLCEISGLSAKCIRASLTPIMRCIPGKYSLEEKSVPKRRLVVGAEHARQVLVDEGITPPSHWLDTHATYVLRFTMATFLPWLDVSRGELDHGLSCWGCRRAVDGNIFIKGYHKRRDRAYSREEFLEHVSNCRDAQEWLKFG